jgi:hypothetical protein
MVYSRSGVKIPPEKSPAALYRKMFVQGKPDEVNARLEDLRRGRSLLDFVSDSSKRLDRQVGPADRDRLNQYFSAVRDLEVQLAQAQDWERKPKPKAPAPEPVDVADQKKLSERIRLMLAVARLGLQTDSTRVVTLFLNTFSIVPEIPGVKQETHSLTHHGGRPEVIDELSRIEAAQFRELGTFLGGLDAVKEEGETLLDRTMVLYGTPMGSANSHSNLNLPVLLAGGGFKHAGHLAFDAKKNYPLPNSGWRWTASPAAPGRCGGSNSRSALPGRTWQARPRTVPPRTRPAVRDPQQVRPGRADLLRRLHPREPTRTPRRLEVVAADRPVEVEQFAREVQPRHELALHRARIDLGESHAARRHLGPAEAERPADRHRQALARLD